MIGPIVLSGDNAVEFLRNYLFPDKKKIEEVRDRVSDISITKTGNGFKADIPGLDLDFLNEK